MKFNKFLLPTLFITGMTLLSAAAANAKMLPATAAQNSASQKSLLSAAAGSRLSAAAADLESRLRPFIQSKLTGYSALSRLPQSQLPREIDFLRLARMWDRLSPGFRALYKMATQIPDTFSMYVSPGGHFEVYYTITDPQSKVDPADTIHYGTGSDWRPRQSGPNGIPDYVDEVAWALDSSWSMEIDRFNFIPPLPNKDSTHTSDRYRAVITWFTSGWYAMTYPEGKTDSMSPKGYTSYIEIRNEWSGSEWRDLGYDLHPENGIRVTCAHELFHGVQYAMTWNLPYDSQLDDFPLTWIEGTAVLMEELAFDYVNDYLQYAGFFFYNPQMSFLDSSLDMRVYSNSILAKYLFEKAMASPGIDIIRKVHFDNYAQRTPFHPNLRTSSLSSGNFWAIILNRFHTGSYYTGARADTARFFADAALLGEWSYSHDVLSLTNTVTKTVHPCGMQTFGFTPDTAGADTFSFSLACERFQDTVPYPVWAASCIVRGQSRPDSVFSLPVDIAGQAACRIAGWKSRSEILIIVSSGHPSQIKNATITVLRPSRQLVIFPNPGRLRERKFVRFEGNDVREVRLYSVDGTLVWNSCDARRETFDTYNGGLEWKLVNGQGKKVVPGYYSAVVTQRDTLTNAKKSSLHKVLVVP